MTSSLVGSEMCIRDRLLWLVWVLLLLVVSRVVVVAVVAAQQCGGFVLRPVSYTHLTLPTICSV
eukprot:3495198-Prorocentrum_lima.AAC.1